MTTGRHSLRPARGCLHHSAACAGGRAVDHSAFRPAAGVRPTRLSGAERGRIDSDARAPGPTRRSTRTRESRTSLFPAGHSQQEGAPRALRRLRLARHEGSAGERRPMGDLRSGAFWPGSAAESKPVCTGRTIVGAVLSATILGTGDRCRGSIPTHPAPGRGLRLLSTPPALRHLVQPARSGPIGDGRPRECRVAGGVGAPFRRVCSADMCRVCVEAARLAFRLHRNLTLGDR
jgi:hypothetical protein